MAALALGACGDGSANMTEDSDEENAAIPVQVQRVERGDVFAIYSGTAALEAEEEAEVVAKVGGEILEIFAEEGDRVKAGQLLARLDDERLRLELEQAAANLRKLEEDFARNRNLHQQGLVSTGTFDTIKYDLEALGATHDMAKLELSYTEIRSPISGVVSQRYIKVGNTLEPNAPTFSVTDLEPLLAYLHVPEREFSKLRPAQPAAIDVDALPGERFSGQILRISPVMDPDTGTFKTTVEVRDESLSLKPGMFARVSIVYDRHDNALLVPRVAIVDDQAQSTVFVIEDGVAHRRVVRTGLTRDDQIEITAGLTGEENVVIVGQAGLSEGTRVEVIGAVPTGARVSQTETL